MSDKLPIVTDEAENGDLSPSDTRSASPTAGYGSTSAIVSGFVSHGSGREISTDPIQHHYEELLGNSVPCPSCRGSGRIPRELERELVALIPVSDKRLKPRRIWLWVLLGGLAALTVCGLVLFFLIPRSMSVRSDSAAIEEVRVVEFAKGFQLILNFLNSVKVSNANYYSVLVSNASATIINRFQPWLTDVIGKGTNVSGFSIPLRSHDNTLLLNNTVTLRGNTLDYCSGYVSKFISMYVLMEFDMTVTFEYMGHHEQETISTTQQVCCVPSGNCTSELL